MKHNDTLMWNSTRNYYYYPHGCSEPSTCAYNMLYWVGLTASAIHVGVSPLGITQCGPLVAHQNLPL